MPEKAVLEEHLWLSAWMDTQMYAEHCSQSKCCEQSITYIPLRPPSARDFHSRTRCQHNEDGANTVDNTVLPDRTHAPPHDAIADHDLVIIFVLVNVHRKVGSEVLTYVDTDSDGHHP